MISPQNYGHIELNYNKGKFNALPDTVLICSPDNHFLENDLLDDNEFLFVYCSNTKRNFYYLNPLLAGSISLRCFLKRPFRSTGNAYLEGLEHFAYLTAFRASRHERAKTTRGY